MEATTAVAPPPQRVCPKCARISYATGPRCPYCTARFSSGRRVSPGMLAAAVAIVLIGVLAMFFIAGRILENRVDDRIEEVNKDFDASLNRFREDVKKELDARIPTTGAGTVPTPTPFPAETPTPAPTTEGQTTPTPTASPSPTTTAEATPTETPRTEIRP
jgi:cell division septation protein DedD